MRFSKAMLADLPPAARRFSAMRAWALFYLCTTSRLEGSTSRSAARQPAACRRVLVARAHLIGSELKVAKLEEFFSIMPLRRITTFALPNLH